jgi:hypothetical protein
LAAAHDRQSITTIELERKTSMYRTHGLYVPTHRPLPVSALETSARLVDGHRQVPGVTGRFMFTRMLLVTGIVLAGVVLATLVSA